MKTVSKNLINACYVTLLLYDGYNKGFLRVVWKYSLTKVYRY